MNPPLEVPEERRNLPQLQNPEEKSNTEIRRRVSRVESLRRLLLGPSHLDSKRLFDKRKYRFGRNSVSKVDKSIGTDLDFIPGSEDDLFDRTSSRFNVSCDSFDLDSVSQLSLMDSTDGKHSTIISKSISIDNIPQEMSSFLRSGFSHTFSKSKLASLPEEQGTLTRNNRNQRPGAGDLVGDDDSQFSGPQSLNSGIKPGNSGTLRRKRSQSLADIHSSQVQIPLQFRTGETSLHHKKFSKTKSEESGYDSDTTRKSGSSPRGSVKSDSFDPSETDSSTCDSHLKPEPNPTSDEFSVVTSIVQPKPKMKKPPRKSKEEPHKTEISCQTESENQSEPVQEPFSSSHLVKPTPPLPINFTDNIPTTLPSLTSKSFKMLRVLKKESDELGIIISKKRNPSKGTTGYIIAHIEPDGLVNK